MNFVNHRYAALAATLALVAATTASAGSVHYGYSGAKHDPDKFQYAIIERGSQTCSISGDDSWARIEELQDEVKETGREVMYFRIGGKDYVVRDRAAVRRAIEITRPMSELGKQQGELGARQGELGARQGELGALQGRIGALQGRVAALQASRDPQTRAEAAEIRAQLAELSAEARALGARQRDLGARQRELGARQRVLGERQREASKLAHEELRTLAEKTIRDGTADRM
jgi:hypothetical protein